ncbi:hypothetical protein [Hyphomicrobium sp.]|uniref:hypothetical protein n=1 Tax=Hyphomicrobium sp. TaxID=82 RepID=UPI001D5EF9D7|nr:hypothetical protein [Hyphomicrobium sp.]MBY0560473.1 hypothetical protein [Hyphomicrobium sp.]
MNLQSITQDIDKLSAADAVIVNSYARYILKKSALCAISAFIAICGLGLLELASFWLLEPSLGPAGAVAVLGAVNVFVALLVFAAAVLLKPGHELSFALTVRKSAIQALEQDVSPMAGRADAAAFTMGEALVSAVVFPLLATLLRNFKGAQPAKTELAETEK